MQLAQGLDADTDLRPYISAMKAAGLTFTMRYLKNLTPHEFAALKAAQLAVGLIYETTSGRAMSGAEGGAADGLLAKTQALTIAGQDMPVLHLPAGAAIFATVDSDVQPDAIAAVIDYFAAFSTAIWPEFHIGCYGSGYVLDALTPHGLTYKWLAGAMGWRGSHDYYNNEHDWSVWQGPTLAEGGHWPHGDTGLDWPNIGTPYDPDLATTLDWAV